MKKILVLHAWYSMPESNWYPWLRAEAEKKGYQVFVPDLPSMRTDLPDMVEQFKQVDQALEVDGETTVVGHSLGSVLGLRLAERKKFAKLLLFAGWDFNDLTVEHRKFWPSLINHDKVRQNVGEIVCFSSDNDPYFTAFQVEEMSKRLSGKFVLCPGKGHFSKELNGVTEVSEILKHI